MMQKSRSNLAKPPTSATAPTKPATASKETAREKYSRIASVNPKFKEAKESGQIFGIVGARLPKKKT
jgi:hypothetical protein